MKAISFLVVALGCTVPLMSASVQAQPGADGDGHPPRRPPKEAVDACEGADEGDACSFAGREGETLSGTCEGPPDASDKPLACRPEGAPPPPQGGGGQDNLYLMPEVRSGLCTALHHDGSVSPRFHIPDMRPRRALPSRRSSAP